MIVAHLIGNTRDLVTCSLISHSWYIAAFPLRHNTLNISTNSSGTNERFTWPEALLQMGELGFLPFVRKLQIRRCYDPPLPGISPKLFNRCTLRHFFALSNVQELVVDCLDIPSFVPRIQRYFGHFMPTVRSLALNTPEGSCQQLVYFIGLFEHLEDLKLLHYVPDPPEYDPKDGQTLIPPFVPPLRGRLTIMESEGLDILEEMTVRFGGIRFRWMHLYDLDQMQPLLGACAETLETLRLSHTDLHGEDISLNRVRVPTDDFTATLSRWDFDLSQLKSLRTFQISAGFILDVFELSAYGVLMDSAPDDALASALSTITSPVFSEVTIFYRDCDICEAHSPLSDRPRSCKML